jgi:hypothetical protein
MPGAVGRCTRILWPGKAAGKIPRGVNSTCLREISQSASINWIVNLVAGLASYKTKFGVLMQGQLLLLLNT